MIATDPIHQNHAFRQIPANARSQCVSLQISQSLGNGKHFDESKWKKEYKTAWGTQFNRMMGTSYCPNNATFLILWTRPSVLCRVKTAYFRGNTTIVKKKWRQTILIRQPGCLSQGKTSQHMSAFHFNHHPKQCTTKFNLFNSHQCTSKAKNLTSSHWKQRKPLNLPNESSMVRNPKPLKSAAQKKSNKITFLKAVASSPRVKLAAAAVVKGIPLRNWYKATFFCMYSVNWTLPQNSKFSNA